MFPQQQAPLPQYETRPPSNGTTKTVTMAGLLGVFLGAFGVHDFYLGYKKLGIIHVVLFALGAILAIVGTMMSISSVTNVYSYLDGSAGKGLATGGAVTIIGSIVMVGNAIWGLASGIMIFCRAGKYKHDAYGNPLIGASIDSAQQPVLQQPVPGANPALTQQPMQPAVAQQPTLAAPPRPPMSPETKKKFVLFGAIAAAVIVIGVAALFLVPMIFKVDYAGAYRIAKEIKPESFSGISETISACDNMVKYVDSTSQSEKDYSDNVATCSAGFSSALTDKIDELGKQSAVKSESSIKALYEEFNAEWDKLSGEIEKYKAVSATYVAWHEYVNAVDSAPGSFSKITDAEINAVYDILVESGNETLKAYGEAMAEKSLVAARAAREYDSYKVDYGSKDYLEQVNHKNQLNTTYQTAVSDRSKYNQENRPDIKTLAPVETISSSNLNKIFNGLYTEIRAAYVEHFDAEDGLCSVVLGIPACE